MTSENNNDDITCKNFLQTHNADDYYFIKNQNYINVPKKYLSENNCIVKVIDNILDSIVDFLYNINPKLDYSDYGEVYGGINLIHNHHNQILYEYFKKIYNEDKDNFNNIYNKIIKQFCNRLKELNNDEIIDSTDDDDNYYYNLIEIYKRKLLILQHNNPVKLKEIYKDPKKIKKIMYHSLFEHLFYKQPVQIFESIIRKFNKKNWNIFKINNNKLNKQIYGKMNIHKLVK
jgi:hypothetical protein